MKWKSIPMSARSLGNVSCTNCTIFRETQHILNKYICMNVKYKGDLWKTVITCMGCTFIFYTLKHFDVESQVFDDHFDFLVIFVD